MNRKYSTPEIEIIEFDIEDIITTSDPVTDDKDQGEWLQ